MRIGLKENHRDNSGEKADHEERVSRTGIALCRKQHNLA